MSLKPLEKLMLVLNEKTSKEDLVLAFQAVLMQILKHNEITETEIDQIKRFNEEVTQALKDDLKFRELKQQVDEAIAQVKLKKGEQGEKGDSPTKEELISLIQPLIPSPIEGKPGLQGERGPIGPVGERGVPGRDGKDGKDAVIDEEKLLSTLMSRLPIQTDTPAEIRDKLQSLKGNDRLDKSAIKGLEEMRRGGVSLGAVSKLIKFISSEVPTGTIDGVNTSFYLAKAPETNSLQLFRGGARQLLNDDYTLLGKTITFTIAPVPGEKIIADYRY